MMDDAGKTQGQVKDRTKERRGIRLNINFNASSGRSQQMAIPWWSFEQMLGFVSPRRAMLQQDANTPGLCIVFYVHRRDSCLWQFAVESRILTGRGFIHSCMSCAHTVTTYSPTATSSTCGPVLKPQMFHLYT